METANNSTAGNVVQTFLNALNNEDFKTARECLNDDMKFEGVLGSRDGADAYMKDMQHMKFKYEIKKQLAGDTDVSVLYDINMQGIIILTAGWYHLKNGKIQTIKVVFDPRPALEKK